MPESKPPLVERLRRELEEAEETRDIRDVDADEQWARDNLAAAAAERLRAEEQRLATERQPGPETPCAPGEA